MNLRNIACYKHVIFTWHVKYVIFFSIEIGSLMRTILFNIFYGGFLLLFVFLLVFVSTKMHQYLQALTVPKSTAKFTATNLFTSKGQIYQNTFQLLALFVAWERTWGAAPKDLVTLSAIRERTKVRPILWFTVSTSLPQDCLISLCALGGVAQSHSNQTW